MAKNNDKNFNELLLESEENFRKLVLKTSSLDEQITELKNELKQKENANREAMNSLQELKDDTETEKTLLLSLRSSYRKELEIGEIYKKEIAENNKHMKIQEEKQKQIILTYEQECKTIADHFREDFELYNKNILKKKLQDEMEAIKEVKIKRKEIIKEVENLQNILEKTKQNSEWDGLNQIHEDITSHPIDETDIQEEQKLLSMYSCLQKTVNKRMRNQQNKSNSQNI